MLRIEERKFRRRRYPVEPPRPVSEAQQSLENFCSAIPELASLERYERRA